MYMAFGKLQTFILTLVLFVGFYFYVPVFGYSNSMGLQSPMNPSERLNLYLSRLETLPNTITKLNSLSRLPSTDETWRLPFAAGSSVFQDQGYNGSFSHQKTFALDMRSPESMIFSARNGTISTINFDGKWDQWCVSNEDCSKKGGIWRGNHILINHSDGSTSYYLHFQGGSLQPNLWVGKYIEQGTPLGIQGFSGYTCLDLITPCTTKDPHLHFQVNKEGKSIPIKFEDCFAQRMQCNDGIPVFGSTNISTNLSPNSEFNNSTGSIFYLDSTLVVKSEYPKRGSSIILSSEQGEVRSKWQLLPTGEFVGLNNWCLEASNNQILIKDCTGNDNQKWIVSDNNRIRSKETSLCWDSFGGESYNSKIYLSSCHSGLNQRWLVKIG
jgi:murein DD-endopeptidase MepM/ murein hydrolase activator NlpD